MSEEINKYSFTADKAFSRIDLLLVEYFEEIGDLFSRNSIQKLIKTGFVKINGKTSKPSRGILGGEYIEIEIPKQPELNIEAENIPINVVYEDQELIVINKSAGMVVHPAPGNYSGTLVNALLHYCKGNISSVGGPLRPGIVHRLDKDTSGLMVVAKTNRAHLELARQFSVKSARREYWAVVWGELKKKEGRIETFYGRHPNDRKKFTSKLKTGKVAITNYFVISINDEMSLLRVILETGRTHQIRVHMYENGYPIVGDNLYSSSRNKQIQFLQRQALHAKSLTFEHPILKLLLTFSTPIPEDMEKLICESHLLNSLDLV